MLFLYLLLIFLIVLLIEMCLLDKMTISPFSRKVSAIFNPIPLEDPQTRIILFLNLSIS